jgi:hypothetical protein
MLAALALGPPRARGHWRNKRLTPTRAPTILVGTTTPCAFFILARGSENGAEDSMDVPRKPLAKSEGRKKLKASGLVIQWRGTPNLDDWVAFIVNGTRSKRLILADHTSERRLKLLLSRIEPLPKREIERLAKG